MWGAYFCMGAYKRRCGCCNQYIHGACFLWVLIIPILQYIIMYCVLLYHKVIQLSTVCTALDLWSWVVYIQTNTLFYIATYSLYNVHNKAPLGIVKLLYLLP